MLEDLLMIFTKNPLLGKVKTRLAQTLGDEKALLIYQKLLQHTHIVTRQVKADKIVFYSDFVNERDIWADKEFEKLKQKGSDLGEKMLNAFSVAFYMGYKRVVIIGSDCFEINKDIIQDAFNILADNDVVLGPARDGGYYLLGMQKFHKQFFENKTWSAENVLLDTLSDMLNLGLSFKLLPTLSDVDEEKDLLHYPNILDQ